MADHMAAIVVTWNDEADGELGLAVFPPTGPRHDDEDVDVMLFRAILTDVGEELVRRYGSPAVGYG